MDRHTKIEERAQAGTMLVAYILAYGAAIIVLFLDLFVWRPW